MSRKLTKPNFLSLKYDFPPSAADKGLSYFWWLCNSSRRRRRRDSNMQSHPEIAPPRRGLGIPENPKAALSKIIIRERKFGFVNFINILNWKFISELNICLIMFFTVFCFSPSNVSADNGPNLTESFYLANLFYKENKYDQAINEYNKILKQGFENGNLYYNLGNSYFKKGMPGKAALNYERARLFMPNDGDLKSNYDYTLSLLNLGRQEFAENLFLKSVNRLYEGLTINSLCLFLSFLFTACFLILILRMFINQLKRFDVLLALIIMIPFVLGIIALNKKIEYLNKGAIIISKETAAKFEPLENATTFFNLSEGSKVEVIDSTGGWYKIKRIDDKIGWVNKTAVELINPEKT